MMMMMMMMMTTSMIMIMMVSDSEAVMVTTTFVQRCGGVEVIIARSRPWPGRTAIWRMIMLVVITVFIRLTALGAY